MELDINVKDSSYTIHIEKGIIDRVDEYVDLKRKVLIITDAGVPIQYAERVLAQCQKGMIHITPNGEAAKSFSEFEKIIGIMLENNFSRKDLVIAVGGGVVGDLSGFVASTYMRGMEFVNIPTTLLSQVDSSIGGKVAINAYNTKNTVGAFHQPLAVFIDVLTHETLESRQISSGMSELIKHGLIYNKDLFYLIKNTDVFKSIENVIYESLKIKKMVVEQDTFEAGIRKTLNFGHTIGHGIESYFGMKDYLHGEAIAIGMVKITTDSEMKQEIIEVFEKFNLPIDAEYDKDEVYELITHDKKAAGNKISIILLESIGKCYIEDVDITKIKEYL